MCMLNWTSLLCQNEQGSAKLSCQNRCVCTEYNIPCVCQNLMLHTGRDTVFKSIVHILIIYMQYMIVSAK